MGNLSGKYRLSIYSELAEVSKGKIYIVKSSLDDKIYIKKILEAEKYDIYSQIQSLSIPDIARIYELIVLDDKLIVIEEYINGHSLKEILAESKTIPEEKVIEYTLALIDIIEKLHSSPCPIIHKDIKPSNIMINNDGILKLIDFDISRIHRDDKKTDTHILGTYGYAAPEQFGFNQTDLRTDIFAIGVTMNMMLVGKLPTEEIYQGELSKIISKCISLDPDKRFQNVSGLKNKLLVKKKKYRKKKKIDSNNKLPGFRSRSFLLRIVGFLWYAVLIIILLGLTDEGAPSKNRIIDIVLSLFLFSLTLLYGNFNNLKTKLPIISSRNRFISLGGYVIYSMLLFIVLAIIIPK